MIKFFRHIRKALLGEGKFSKYLLYAIGEIILVVIGILIALSVNNWNTANNEQKEVNNYYKRIHLELVEITDYFHFLDSILDQQYAINKRSLELLKNKDSLQLLKKSIGTLGSNLTTNFSAPILEEFFEKGLLSKVKDDSIKFYLRRFKAASKSLDRYDVYLDAQYVNAVEPFFSKRINYAEVSSNRRNLMITGGPKTDYQQFADDLELWNLLSFKLEAIEVHKDRLHGFLKGVEILDKLIVKQTDD